MKYLLLLLLCVSAATTTAQDLVYKDEKTCAIVKHGLDKMYNMEFDDSEKLFLEVKKKYPNSPAYDFLMSMHNFQKIFYNNTYKEKSTLTLNYLLVALEKNKKLDAKYPNNPEVVFFYMSIYSTITLYYSQRKETMKAINYAKKTYDYMRQGYALKDTYHELYFSAGIYDFYREQYPESHSAYKSFMWLFAPGNKVRGIKELETASEASIFTRTEAHFYLAIIRIKYLCKYQDALINTEYLYKNYPQNINFFARHIEALLMAAKYDEAEKLLPHIANTQRKVFDMAYHVFKGIILEKKHKNTELAMGHYAKAIQLSKQVEFPVNDFLGHANIGIARVLKLKGDHKNAEVYFKKTIEDSSYEALKKEAALNLK